ncbi:hypothetical protein K2V61_07620 [Staphylococcus simulans]|nr:hypothetical protein [Staphylococcus simulans]MCD8915407.1 hypothetical protein [Staphylococcus simulans]
MYFIIRNEQYFNAEQVTLGKNALNKSGKKEKQYLRELVDKNLNVDFEKLQNNLQREYQLELFNPEKTDKMSSRPVFNIITYAIDAESKQLSAIKIWVPNPHNNQAILFEDLTPVLEKLLRDEEDYSIPNSDLVILQNAGDSDEELVDAQDIFGFEIGSEEEEASD